MTTIYNVKFILSHAVVITAVPVDDELGSPTKQGSNPDGSTSPADVIRIAQEARRRKVTEEEVVKAAKTFLEWDGIDVSRADAIEVEKA